MRALTDLSGVALDINNHQPLFLVYADLVKESKPPPEPASAFADSQGVPGLTVVNDFISLEQEEILLNGLCSAEGPWIDGISRRVQVYVYRRTIMTLHVCSIMDIPLHMKH